MPICIAGLIFGLVIEEILFLLRGKEVAQHTVRNVHFLSKNSTLISRENYRFFLYLIFEKSKKNRENEMDLRTHF